MRATIVDALGIRHRSEPGASRDTRCGRLVGGDATPGGDVDCMACAGGPSLLSIEDLRDGVDVTVWIQLIDRDGKRASDSSEMTFVRGRNAREVRMRDLTAGATIVAYRYHAEDDRTVWIGQLREPIIVHHGDTLAIAAGEARVA
jgi:hypothetical protein